MRAPAEEAYQSLAQTLCGPRKVVWVDQARAETGEQAETWADWFRHRSLLLCSRAVMHVPSGTYGSDTLPPAPNYAEERAWLVLPSKCPILLARLVPPEDYSEPPIRPTVRSLPPLETASSAAVDRGRLLRAQQWLPWRRLGAMQPRHCQRDSAIAGRRAAPAPRLVSCARPLYPLRTVPSSARVATMHGALRPRLRRRALAFEHFLLVHNQGRPFILAAHGQVRAEPGLGFGSRVRLAPAREECSP